MFGPNSVGVRRLWVLIDGLPPDGVLARKLRGHSWAEGSSEYLLAIVCELLDAQYRAFVAANSKRPRQMKPLTIPRPGQKSGETVRMTPGEFVRRRKEVSDGEGG